MKKSIFNDCKWLTFPDCDAVLTRSLFRCEDIKKAVLKITALGYFEAFVNGNSLSDSMYIPAMTDYEKRDLSKIHMPIFDTLSHRIYYHEFDVTAFMQKGENVLAVHIGAGWYGQHESPNEGMPYWGDNTLVFSLEITLKNSETVFVNSSESSTKFRKSYILETSLYYGEYHDARLFPENWTYPDFDDSSWHTAKTRLAPEAFIEKSFFPEDKVVRTIKPTVIYEFGDMKIYDIGELAAGFAVITFDEKARTNDRCTVRYADELNEDKSLQFHYCGGTSRMQFDRFVYNRNSEEKEFYPHFTWHAARYIEVTGACTMKEYRVVHTGIEQISDFSCDNETLQWIFDAYVRTQKTNIHGCIPSDCPHRERLGYTGDGQWTSPAVMSIFNARQMYKKWMADIRDCQDKTNGHVQHTAPFYGGGGGPGGWGGAAVIVPFMYYKFYDDIDVLRDSYESMKLYLKYMVNHTEDGIVTHAEKGGWCLGDWCPPNNKILIPPEFVNTYFLAKCALYTAKTAEILGYTQDITTYTSLADTSKEAIKKHFFNESTADFCENVQGANAFALDLSLGNEKTVQNFIEKYSSIADFDTGIFGTYLVIKLLFELNEGDAAFRLLVNEGENSFYNMKKHGATTIWENWNGCDSRCHPMFGAVTELFFSEILGIKRYDECAGYSEIIVSPADISSLKHVEGTMRTAWGDITVKISTSDDGKREFCVKTTGNIQVKNR